MLYYTPTEKEAHAIAKLCRESELKAEVRGIGEYCWCVKSTTKPVKRQRLALAQLG